VKSISRKQSEWAIIDGFQNDVQIKQSSQFLKFSKEETDRIKQLQGWMKQFFA